MGISNFHKWLVTQNVSQKIFKAFPVAILAIDLSCILHIQARHSKSISSFISNVRKTIKQLTKRVPCKKLAIFMDGPAPLAKLMLQIKRRSWPSKDKGINSLWLTPGTEVLDQIESNLSQVFPDAFISSHREAGEGEVKIIKYLHQIAGNSSKHGRYAIYSSDSDVVSILSAARPLTNVYLILPEKAKLSAVSIDTLWKNIKCTRDDLSVLATLTGNDYLPGLPGITMDSLLKNYKNTIVKQGRIRTKALLLLLESTMDDKKTVRIEEDSILCDPDLYFQGILWCLDMYATGSCSNWQYTYRNLAPNKEDCLNYLHSIKSTLSLRQSKSPNNKPLTCDETLLLLLPHWGRDMLPERLHAIRDHPELAHWTKPLCQECSVFKEKIAELNRRYTIDKSVRSEIVEINKEYKEHRQKEHPFIEPPLNIIKKLIN
tara:strand:- start:2903 stop:4195 length:1293 start_codon:yes stop_codon:yes gene_type:complete